MNGTALTSNSIMPTSEIVSILKAEFLAPAQVAALLKASRKALADARLKRQGPPFELKARGTVVYSTEGFIRYLRGQAGGNPPAHNRRARVEKLLARVENK